MTTFFVWLLLLAIGLILATRSVKKRQVLVDETERVASEELPKIGAIAERAHSVRFGRPPTNIPLPPKNGRSHATSWYPETKRADVKRPA